MAMRVCFICWLKGDHKIPTDNLRSINNLLEADISAITADLSAITADISAITADISAITADLSAITADRTADGKPQGPLPYRAWGVSNSIHY